jgi:hypothetical protein
MVHGWDWWKTGSTGDICESTAQFHPKQKAHSQVDYLLMDRSLHKSADGSYSDIEKAGKWGMQKL